MNFLSILQGNNKASSQEMVNAIIDLENKKNTLSEQAEPLRKELSGLLKKDLAGVGDVRREINDARAKVAEINGKIEACDESIQELREKLLERLFKDKKDRIEQIDAEVMALRDDKERWQREQISAYARFMSVCEYICPGMSQLAINDLSPERRDFYREEVERFRKELKIEGNSIESRLNVILHEKQTLHNHIVAEEDVEAAISSMRAQ